MSKSKLTAEQMEMGMVHHQELGDTDELSELANHARELAKEPEHKTWSERVLNYLEDKSW